MLEEMMNFTETRLAGAYVIEPNRIEDHRGFFARTWCSQEFKERGLNSDLVQCNISFNTAKGTLRGMHYQIAPYQETKVIRCTKGAIYDVIIDLRPGSVTYTQWTSVELTAENRLSLYVPEGFAHGFQTLKDDTEVFYQMTEFYNLDSARGVRWNDPAFEIRWPISEIVISQRDETYKLLGDEC